MENSCLNIAHQQYRRAETHVRYRRFDEAIECHHKAVELLTEALTLTENPHSLESLRLQVDYHRRQQKIILVKKQQYENYRRAIENQRNRLLNTYTANDYEENHESESTSLQVAIYRTMEEADSLLSALLKKSSAGNSDSESLKSYSTSDTDERPVAIDVMECTNSNPIVATKHPKDEGTIIEELKTVNEQLHVLVYRLVGQLDASMLEVDVLHERIKKLESQKSEASTKNNVSSLKVTTDSSGGTSPYVYTPSSELSPDMHEARVLPTLAPLEFPNFTIGALAKKNGHTLNTSD